MLKNGLTEPLRALAVGFDFGLGVAGVLVEMIAAQLLDDVFLAKLEVVVGRVVLVEFLLGLAAEVVAIDQEQHAPRPGKLDQAVDEGNRCEGLAAAGGHLDQRARLVGGQAGFDVVRGLDLHRPAGGAEQAVDFLPGVLFWLCCQTLAKPTDEMMTVPKHGRVNPPEAKTRAVVRILTRNMPLENRWKVGVESRR